MIELIGDIQGTHLNRSEGELILSQAWTEAIAMTDIYSETIAISGSTINIVESRSRNILGLLLINMRTISHLVLGHPEKRLCRTPIRGC